MPGTASTEMFERGNALLQEALVIVSNEKASAEDVSKAEKMIEEGKELKARAVKLDELTKELQSGGGDVATLPNYRGGGVAKWTGWPEFAKALAQYALDGVIDERLEKFREKDDQLADSQPGRNVKDLSGATGPTGGFLIPIESYSQLMSIAAPLSIVRPRATIIRMNRRQVSIPLLEQSEDAVTNGFPSFFGGIQVYWVEEGALKPESAPKFRRLTLTAHKLVGYTRAPDELLADAETSLSDFLGGPLGFPGAIAWAEDYAFLRGSGVGQPQGVVDAPATIEVTRETAATVTYTDLVNMMSAFWGENPVWVATTSLKAKLMLMNGPSGNPSYLWGDAQRGIPDTLLGYPIRWTDKLPAPGYRGDILLADFRHYLIGDRQAGTIETSRAERFQYDETSFRLVHRVDGQPWMNGPIHLSNDQDVSPFVVLNEDLS